MYNFLGISWSLWSLTIFKAEMVAVTVIVSYCSPLRMLEII